jgi:hypothetical protein
LTLDKVLEWGVTNVRLVLSSYLAQILPHSGDTLALDLTLQKSLLFLRYPVHHGKKKKRALCIGEGPEYRPFCNFRSVPRPVCRGKRLKIAEGLCTQVLFLSEAELGYFHFLEIVTGWLAPSKGQKNPVQPGWYLPPRKIPLAENRFLQAGNGAENTKEKSRQSFTFF